MDSFGRVVRVALFVCFLNYCSAKYFIAAPNLLRVGVEETVSVTVFDVGGLVNVKLFLQDYPHRKRKFSEVEGNFQKDKPGILKVKVDVKDLSDQKSLDKQYVYLVATSSTPGSSFRNEMQILVSYRNSMVLIQTDKPIYTPGQTVNLRVVPLDLDLKPSLKNVTIEIMVSGIHSFSTGFKALCLTDVAGEFALQFGGVYSIKNPQGIRVDRWRNLNTDEGFFSERKYLSKNALLGNWTVSALYGHGLVQNTSVQFEVKEYVLPTFSVKVKGPPYILENDKVIRIKVTSEYTYGKKVVGNVQLSLAVLDDAGKTTRFSTSFLELIDGATEDVISTDLLKNHQDNLWFPEGKRLFIEAKVTEKATGKQEEALDNTIYFTKTPFKISFKRTPKFFKPGVPYEVKVDVSYMNGKPASKIDMEIKAETDAGVVVHERRQGRQQNTATTDARGYASFVVDVPKDYNIKHLVINVKTKATVPSEQVYQPTMYSSSGNNYLFVRVPKSRVGESVHAEAFALTSTNPKSLSYLVVAHGKVVAQGTVVRNIGVVTTIRITVVAAMSPQARFIVYYAAGNEIVTDSTIMEVAESFPNQVGFAGRKNPQKIPGELLTVTINAQPYSRVGILAVDQSVYLLRNDKQLTSDTVFKKVKSHDLGCGSGGGQNNKDVFMRGGLAVMSDYGLKTSLRNDYSCAAGARKRRSLQKPLTPQQEEKCCKLGETVDPRSCQIRAQNFSGNVGSTFDPVQCVIKYFRCCKMKFEKTSRARAGDNDLPPELLNNLGIDLDEELLKETLEDAQIRTNFPETWLYEDQKAGKDGEVQFRVTVPDTITTWVMQAIAVSNTTGFGLTPPHYLTAFKHFFVSLSMPYSAQRGEQVSIVATVYNYQENQVSSKVKLLLTGSSDFCSHVEPNERFTIYDLRLKGKNAASVSFPIVPKTIGDIPIRVTAAMLGMADVYERTLRVLPEGMQRRKTYSVVLDPQDVLIDPKAPKPSKPPTPSAIKTGSKGNGEQKNSLRLSTPASTIPDSESAQLFLMGNLIGPVVANVIEGRGLDSIIQLPTGCGEQTMLRLAPNVFVLQYLRATKQVTPQIEETAFKFIKSGYQRELGYRRSDHSFSAFGNSRPGSTWLTAFVIKTFCAAQKFGGVDIDQQVICSAMRFLSNIQRADGAIPERHPVIHQEMNGDINGEIAMTAYVVTAFMECRCPSQSSVNTIKKAVTYLENSRPKIGRVYVKAVVAYALALASSPQRFAANNDLLVAAHYDAGKNTRYWTDGGNAINVETTSYALLTQMALGRISYSGPIVVWLTEQRKGGGGFVSTQDTCVALQALAAYSQTTGGDRLDLTVEITSSMVQDYKKILRVDKKNALVQQRLDLSGLIGGDIFITTKGSGVAQLQIETRYNTPASEKESCQFDLTVNTVEAVKPAIQRDQVNIGKPKNKKPKRKNNKKKGRKSRCRGRGRRRCRGRRRGRGRRNRNRNRRRNKKPTVPPTAPPTPAPIQRDQPASNSISFKVCARSKRAGGTTGMAIIDVGILTGFSVVEESLKELKKNVQPSISMYEISDRHVVLYVDKIPDTHSLCYTLEMKRDFEVGLVQAVPVTVYDYYEPDNKCTTYYGPKDDSQLNLGLCDQNSCRCTLDKCTSDKTSDNAVYVVNNVCRKYDYVVKVEVRGIDEKSQWLKIDVDVKEIYKIGKKKLVKGQRITFKKKASCDSPRITASTIDSHFLIMGKDRGLQLQADNSARALMDNELFVKAWPDGGNKFFRRFIRERNSSNNCS